MSEDTLEQAVTLIESGQKDQALGILQGLTAQEPENEKAWLWLTVCMESGFEKRHCLEKVLGINPGNETALQALAGMGPVRPPTLTEVISSPCDMELLEMATQAEKEQDHELSYKLFNQVINSFPDCALAWLGRGRCAAMLNTIDKPRLGEAIESICEGKGLGADSDELRKSALHLASSLLDHVAKLEDKFSEQQLSKMDEMYSTFYSMGFGKSISQVSVNKIGKEQNQKFQKWIPSLIEGQKLAWNLSQEREIGEIVLEVLRIVEKGSILSDTSKDIYKEKINPLIEKIKINHPDLLSSETGNSQINSRILFLFITIIAALAALVYFMNNGIP